jgi:Fe-S cluster biogenesis protein NfuA
MKKASTPWIVFPVMFLCSTDAMGSSAVRHVRDNWSRADMPVRRGDSTIQSSSDRERDLKKSRFSCAENSTEFETIILITHQGGFHAEMTSTDLETMESVIMRVYNDLAEDSCDPQYRHVTRVVADAGNIAPIPRMDDLFQVRYTVSGLCEGCQINERGILFGSPSQEEDRSSDSRSGSKSRSFSSSSSGSRRTRHRQLKGSKSRDYNSVGHRHLEDDSTGREHCKCRRRRRELRHEGPQSDDVQEAINEELQDMMARIMTMNLTVTDLTEAVALECSPKVETFQSVFLISFEGQEALMSDTEVMSLETAFVQTYNDISYNSCDNPSFRRVTDATLDALSNGRSRQRGRKKTGRGDFDSVKANQVVKLVAQGTCHDCQSEPTSLFNGGPVDVRRVRELGSREYRRRLKNVVGYTSTAAFSVDTNQPRQEAGPTCLCSATKADSTGLLGSDMFFATYEDLIDELHDDGILQNLDSFDHVLEVQEIECSTDKVAMQTTVLLVMNTQLSKLDDDDLDALESSFKQVYNELRFKQCDNPLFRGVENVSIDDTLSEEWLGRQPFPSRVNRDQLIRLKITLNSREPCASMFEVGTGERFDFDLDPDESGYSQELQPYDGTCYCPMERPGSDAGLFINVFQEAYNSMIDSSDLDYIDALDELMELEEYRCGNNTIQLQTLIIVEFESTLDNQTGSELQSFEAAMTLIYNNLNWKTCDYPFFRTALNFTLITSLDRLLRDEQAMNASSGAPSPVNTANVMVFSASFEFRHGTSIPGLFSWGNGSTIEPTPLNQSEAQFVATDSLVDTCFCPVNALEGGRSPTEYEFGLALDGIFTSYAWERQGVAEKSQGVKDLVEVMWFDCSSEKFGFQTEIILRLNQNVTELSDLELAAIEVGFKETYNIMNFFICDNVHYRRVLRVRRDLPSTSPRHLQEKEGEDLAQDTRADLLRLVVDVECQQCTSMTTLFSDSIADGPADLQVSLPSSPLLSLLVSRDDVDMSAVVCYCSKAFPSLGRSPTTDEFQVIFNAKVLDILEIADDFSPNVVEEVVEVKQVECSKDVRQFSSFVSIGLQGDITRLTENEKVVLEQTFQDVFNGISFSRCDSLFRSIVNVTLVAAPSSTQLAGRRQLSNNTAFDMNGTSSAQDKFSEAFVQVSGECRGCEVSESGTFGLFDDAFRRTLRQDTPFRRRIQSQNSGCLCPIDTDPVLPSAPTEEEFLTEYNTDVVALSTAGVLVNVKGVSDIK